MGKLNVNGVVREYEAEDDTPLLWDSCSRFAPRMRCRSAGNRRADTIRKFTPVSTIFRVQLVKITSQARLRAGRLRPRLG